MQIPRDVGSMPFMDFNKGHPGQAAVGHLRQPIRRLPEEGPWGPQARHSSQQPLVLMPLGMEAALAHVVTNRGDRFDRLCLLLLQASLPHALCWELSPQGQAEELQSSRSPSTTLHLAVRMHRPGLSQGWRLDQGHPAPSPNTQRRDSTVPLYLNKRSFIGLLTLTNRH